jgi:HK97 family phage portal protein
VILRTRDGDREFRTSLGDLGIHSLGYGYPNSARVPVSPSSVSGIPAFNRAVRIAAEAVASLRMRIWTGDGVDQRRVTSVWQARLFKDALNDVQSRYGFWETVETSLSKRGNAYIWVNPDPVTGRAVDMYALHPDQVLPLKQRSGSIEYNVFVGPDFVDPVGKGYGFYHVGPETILHIRGFDNFGLISPSPIEVYRESLGVGVARLQHEGNTYGKGTALKGVVQLPAGIGRDAADQWRDFWKAQHEGANAQTTAILGGGAEFKTISMSMADAQFIESQQFGVEECARIVGVTATLLDVGGGAGNAKPLTPEHEDTRWFRYGLGPRLERIESALLNYPSLFAEGSSYYPAFDTSSFIRGDRVTEAQIALTKVQSGQWLVDEARALDGMEPLPDGAGQVPQIVPVGGQANPGVPPPADPPPPAEE